MYTFDEYLDEIEYLQSLESLHSAMSITQQIKLAEDIGDLISQVQKIYPEECDEYQGRIPLN